MVSFVSISALLLLVKARNSLVSADTCQGNDPLACFDGGVCVNGKKDYEYVLGVTDAGLMEEEIRGMHCSCPSDNAQEDFGLSGVHCTTPFERCQDDSICFNGGYCERDSFDYDKYHCACPQNGSNVYAGKTCELEATDKCSDKDPFYDLAGTRWFCVNGGKCLDGLTDLTAKCDCPQGFAGLHCEYLESEYEQCNLQCSNGGTCKKGAKDLSEFTDYGVEVDTFLGGSNIDGEHCVCPEGFTGVQCETTDVKPCGDGVCFNGGLCIETIKSDGTLRDYHCECNEFDTNVAGQFCEHTDVRFCPAPVDFDPTMYYCANGGSCPIDEPHKPCTDCNAGWTGPRCEMREKTDNTGTVIPQQGKCDLDCQNGGTCFFGDNPIDEDSKLNLIDGLQFLQDNKHCRCPTGYIGLKCEMRYERCGSGQHYCLHGSGCVPDNDQFTCDCNEVSTELVAYAGHYCEHTATEFCLGPGAGMHSFCTNHGTCRGQVGFGQDHVGCDCKEGWTGEYCEFQIEQLKTDGIATKAFVGFMGSLVGILLVVGLCACLTKKESKQRGTYETAAAHDTYENPYGDEDDEDDEYELKEVTII